MTKLYGNAIVGQSGGPTAAINATLAGVINGCETAKKGGYINKLYGMKNGIEGFLNETLIDLTPYFGTKDLDTLSLTPAAALGSCRRKMKSYTDDKETYDKLLALFKKYDIRYFFYIGGNDSMDTVLKLSEYAKLSGYDMRVVGVPKTIDNDLTATDHTPGFGSAAKFVATTVKEILRDVEVYTVKAVTIVEVMGRDAGWLTASSALPLASGGVGPDLVYLPEVAFDTEEFLSSVRAALDKHPCVLVCASEGIRFADGSYVAASGAAADGFGHVQLSGVGKVLEALVKEKVGCKVRSIELSLPQRCAAHLASLTDIEESKSVGAYGVKLATEDNMTAVMATINREEGEYRATYGYADIKSIANEVRAVPRDYINENGNGLTDKAYDYLLPLIQGEVAPEYENGMPKHFVIK